MRYYEEMGIVLPTHVGENKYRYYSRHNVSHLIRAKFIQSMGFPLSTVKDENSEGMPIGEWLNAVDKRHRELSTEIERAQILLEEITRYREHLKNIQGAVGVYRIVTTPETYFFNFSNEEDEIDNSDQLIDEINKWINLFPTTRYSFVCPKESLFDADKSVNAKRGFVVMARKASLFDIRENELVRFQPLRMCVSTTVRLEMDHSPSSQMLRGAMDYIRAHNLTVNGDAYGFWLFTSKEEDAVNIKYYRAWIPIASND